MFNQCKFEKVCITGLGEVGLPTAMYISSKGLTVFGYDINKDVVSRALKCGIKSVENFESLPSDIDAYIICVSTSLTSFEEPDLTPVFDVCGKIAKRKQKSVLVSIESTIIPGTTRKIYEEIFQADKNVYLVHIPHRYWSGNPVKYGVRQSRVIGAVNGESLKKGIYFYSNILDIPLHPVSRVEVAEMSKIMENAYRYVCIAFAEEARMICEELGLDFEEVRKACNTKWNIEILEARNGISGHCLPKDIRYLTSLTKYNTLLRSAMLVDEQYRLWLSRRTQS
ncbi:MAG: NAD(P)-binding domain-containing protein [Candidatus Aenigmatarchaeota archaeon]